LLLLLFLLLACGFFAILESTGLGCSVLSVGCLDSDGFGELKVYLNFFKLKIIAVFLKIC
jgi:hypothetical protein